MTVNTACDREDVSFIFVEATVRALHQLGQEGQLTLFPSSIKVIICESFSTTSRLRSSTYGPKEGCSRTRRLPLFFGFSKSRTLNRQLRARGIR